MLHCLQTGAPIPDAVVLNPKLPSEPRRPRTAPIAAAMERSADFAALYVIGPRWLPNARQPDGYEQWPLKIGVTQKPANVVASCRQWNHRKVALTALYWTVSNKIARRLKKQLDQMLREAGAHRHGGWFDRDPDVLELELRHIAERNGVELFDENERRVRIDAMVRKHVSPGRLH